jgi:hypothetical protein
VKVTTKVARITAVLADDPIDAISSGSNTTDGITLMKLSDPLLAISVRALSPIAIPIERAIAIPMMKPNKDNRRVMVKSFQKLVRKIKTEKSRATSHA